MTKIFDAEDPRFRPMLRVAVGLGDLRELVVFTGGAVTGLLVTDPGASAHRPTKDVDLIIEIATLADYHALGSRLRALRFTECDEPGAPLCRWVFEGTLVDVMPTAEQVLGFRNRWFQLALDRSEQVKFTDEAVLQICAAPYFCATKLDAFKDRGEGDHAASKDIEDFITIVDGREELVGEIATAVDVQAFLAGTVTELLARDSFRDALPGHLPGDAASQARVSIVVERLERIALLAPPR